MKFFRGSTSEKLLRLANSDDFHIVEQTTFLAYRIVHLDPIANPSDPDRVGVDHFFNSIMHYRQQSIN